ncbi:TPA: N-6 DNA methylase, partial [Methanosarcinaceae archaeon]|nr:N-6 DNA methylase [Methanosarcinaceae archaeon]
MNTGNSGCIHVSGSLIPSQFVFSMQGDTVSFDFAKPSTFKVPWDDEDSSPDSKEYDFRVQDAFESLKRRWDMYGPKLRAMSPEDTRKYWQRPLLEALGFNLAYSQKHREISESLKFNFSHKGWREVAGVPKPPVVHLISPSMGLDDRLVRGEPCAHDALQGYLNTNEDKWAVLTNGLFLRLLRDFHHTTVKGYVEFDIEAIFHNRLFSEFQALYRFAHASRFAPAPSKKKDEPGESYLEEYFKRSQAVGESVGRNLRENVVKAIEAFGNGFLTSELMEILRKDEKECHIYYEEILRVIYRIIFLLYAEQRGLLGGHETPGHDLYLENYSITALRDFAAETIEDNNFQNDSHKDLWEGLLVTFRMIKKGVNELGIYPYNGMLFDMAADKYVGKFSCKNSGFLDAVRFLTLTEIDGVRQSISYADLSVEEFGSIYESLLDYAPRITSAPEEIEGRKYAPNRFILDPRGSDRKSTGSYYTNPGLVQELIKSALIPVLEARLEEATDTPRAKEDALLSIKVCDPACGSGAFLIAACNKLGRELAKIRSGEELPAQDVEQEARRDVLLHCIYGVDINPMAVELAKVSLWINAAVRDKPLNFLDHHIKCGNSLIGATPELMEKGIPNNAFNPVEGDDKKVASHFKKINREQKKNKTFTGWLVKDGTAKVCCREFAKLDEEIEQTPKEVIEKRDHYEALLSSKEYNRLKFLSDLWTSAFFWPLTDEKEDVITNGTFMAYASNDLLDPSAEFTQKVSGLAQEYRFFHWHLEFPDVFNGENQGFDCVLGNPPWERIKLQEKEFFEYRSPDIAKASNASQRKKLIKKLCEDDPALDQAFRKAKCMSECESLFLRESGRFLLTGKGDINTYTVFTEHARNSINTLGYAGIIVPTGIATDNTTSEFFGDIVNKKNLKSLYDFENKEALFPIHRSFKFCLLTMVGREVVPRAFDMAFFLHNLEDVNSSEKHFSLTTRDIKLINPNTLNCPIFRSKRDSEITKQVYRKVPVLINENEKNGNSWGCSFLRMFDMANDSHLFKTKDELEELGFELDGNQYFKENDVFLPLYEAKMYKNFDHRHGTFASVDSRTNVQLPTPTIEDHLNFNYVVKPWYWVPKSEVEKRLNSKVEWFIAFRDIARSTDERTGIFSLLPSSGVNHKSPLVFFNNTSPIHSSLFLANVNSMPFDYVLRTKMGGTSLGYFILKQLPIFPHNIYVAHIIDLIIPRTIELTYTAWDLKPFAEDVLEEIGPEKWNEWFPENPLVVGVPQPFRWDEERRLQLRCELDAVYAHLYGISKDDLDYILGTFPNVRRKDEARYGTYRTRDLIMEYY